jgi:hypothetical protein
MNPFLLDSRSRLRDWKEFRNRLPSLSETEQFSELARYFAQAPLVRYTYDAHDPATWPTMWQMVSDGDWCEQSIAIGMEGTLRLSGFEASRLKLVLINDRDLSEVRFVLQIDDRIWLNYEYGVAREIPDTNRTVMCCWQFDGKKFVSV